MFQQVVVSALQVNTTSVNHGANFYKCFVLYTKTSFYFRQVYYKAFINLRNSLAFIKQDSCLFHCLTTMHYAGEYLC